LITPDETINTTRRHLINNVYVQEDTATVNRDFSIWHRFNVWSNCMARLLHVGWCPNSYDQCTFQIAISNVLVTKI